MAAFDNGRITSAGCLLLRKFDLAGTEMQNAQTGTIGSKVPKIQVRIRRVVLSLSKLYPFEQLIEGVLTNLRRQIPQVMQI